MQVHRINPLDDPRWDDLVASHPRASIFHSAAWLRALRATYGYRPLALTTSSAGEPLGDSFVFCEIHSWLTGNRIVSVPFSDHCEPLVDTPEQFDSLVATLIEEVDAGRWQYAEARAIGTAPKSRFFEPEAPAYVLHQLSLRGTADQIARGFHKNCVQRKIQRAMREGLTCEAGRSERLLRQFYDLLVPTRLRHRMPPQPIEWFRNLVASMRDDLTIRVASKDGRPIAAILTLRHRRTLVYKYGCSATEFNRLGGTHLLFWEAIRQAVSDGLTTFDLGRSDLDNEGLITFKNRWGASRLDLAYLRYPTPGMPNTRSIGSRSLQRVMPLLPARAAVIVGQLLYRHVG